MTPTHSVRVLKKCMPTVILPFRCFLRDGTYVGSVSEGDFLWHILEYRNNDLRVQENYQVSDILRKDFNPAVKIDVSMDELLERSMNQNFIPVVDDRNFFIGIVTRQDIIRSILKEL